MVMMWGGDANLYIGRRMTLYRDPTVKWGGEPVGGIRISHMSDIKESATIPLTITRGSKKPFTVKPLTDINVAKSASSVEYIGDLIDEGNDAADRGTDILKAFWGRMKPAQQKALATHLIGWKETAAARDAADAEFNDASKQANILSAG